MRTLFVATLYLALCGCSRGGEGAGSPQAAVPDTSMEGALGTPAFMPSEVAVDSGGDVPSHCQAGEQVVFSCEIGRRVVSVCLSRERFSYRFGGLNEIELRIDGAADGSNVHYGFIVGGLGGRQESLRFTNGDYDYIVFDGRPGRIFDTQEPYAGLVVLRQGSSVSDEPAFDEKCEGEFQPLQINLENQPKAEDDSFLMWRF